ncbi:MAG TPA: cyanophycinase [Actinomycetota bacterium]|nr:cyanophycinase [Actinomycetota bacterium]
MASRASDPGAVLAIGGAEDKLKDRVILGRFIQLAGGEGARIAVVSTASSLGDEATELYRALFRQAGAGEVAGMRPTTRAEANDPSLARMVRAASGVFLTGGNQLRLSSVVAGTLLGRELLAAHRRGAVIAGTSAGSSALSTHMVAFGASGATPKHRMVQVASGLGIVTNVIIDQHFEQRNRLGRLLSAIAQSPNLLGVGLDEDTAALFEGDELEALGKGAVTIVDGSDIVTDAFFTKGHRPMMVSGAVIHSLPGGWRYDLVERRLVSRDVGTVSPDAQRWAGQRVRRQVRELAAEGADDRAPIRAARRRAQVKEEASE